jgi:hypothetical protein
MLEGNATLVCLNIKSGGGISPDTYISALESLQPSSTLTTLRLSPLLWSAQIKELGPLLKRITL